jgi:hypothetical protein
LQQICNSIKHYEVKALQEGFSFKNLKPSEIAKNLDTLHKLTTQSFEGNFLFEPLPFAGFAKLYVAGQGLQNTKVNIDIVCSSEGKPVGFMLSQIEDRHLVLKTMGILKEFRRGGLAFALASRAINVGLENGCNKLVGALVYQDGKSLNWWNDLTLDAAKQWQHKYALLSKELDILK